jgi:bacteriorhodopsin
MKFLTLPLLLVSLTLSHATTKFTIASDSLSCTGDFYVTDVAISCENSMCTWGSNAHIAGLGKLAAAVAYF